MNHKDQERRKPGEQVPSTKSYSRSPDTLPPGNLGNSPQGQRDWWYTWAPSSHWLKAASRKLQSMQIPRYLQLSLWRERSSSSLRSVCQQRVAGTSNWEGRQERMTERNRSVHEPRRDAQRQGQSSHGLSKGSLPACPFASSHNSLWKWKRRVKTLV